MKVLFIGGTGNISSAVSRLALESGTELSLLTRGRQEIPEGGRLLRADMRDEDAVAKAISDEHFDCVVNWIAFTPIDIEKDIRLFAEKTDQYIFISSASAYASLPGNPVITEETPLLNPHWQYARDKIACERLLEEANRNFPNVIVRPSLTYNTLFPVALGGWGCYTLADRILNDKPIVVHDDGNTPWTVTHADDFAKGFVPLMGNKEANNNAFHITTDEVLTWNEIYESIANALCKTANMIHVPSEFIVSLQPDKEGTLLGDKSNKSIFDNSKIKRFVPGFKASIPFVKGIKRTAEWFDAHPQYKTINDEENRALDEIIEEFHQASR